MEKLKKYYNFITSSDGKMPVFSALSEKEKAKFKNSLGFAFWNAGKAFSEFAAAVKRAILKRKRR